jgi:signal transduction histidine kinase/CHASE3 domain sensor protein/HPt (histidine-containing phosphotransfer) domain-containing protein/ActR/RegA family two-component response regulator
MTMPGPRLLAHASFWLATLAMVAMGWTLYDAVNNEIESSRYISHTQEVRQVAGEIDELLSRAESAQRGYLLTGRTAFLADRDPALTRLKGAIAQVRKLTLGQPDQQRRIAEIEDLIAARSLRLQQSLSERRSARSRAAPGSGLEVSTRIHDLLAELRQEEFRRIRLHRAAADDRHENELWALIAAVVFGIIVLIPGYLGFVMQTRARERTEKRLRLMADSLPCAMYQLRHSAQGKSGFTFLSSGAAGVLGIGTGNPGGAFPTWNSTLEAIDERDRAGFSAALESARKTHSAFRYDYRVRHADGTSRWLHHEASLQKEDGGKVLQNGYVADVTEQRRLEDALQEAKAAADSANRAKSTFLATMSHEIRTPMNGVLGMLELLSLTKLDAVQRATLGTVRESSLSLLRIIDDILDLSKIEAGKLEVLPETTSIGKVIEGIRNIYSGNASSKGLLLKHRVDPQISPAVLVDQLRLRQILGNFVSNSLKFTPEGWIDIRAELIERVNGEDRVRFSVQDTGIGISEESQRRLFQPFTQGDDNPVRRMSGTGLGLTISRRLAAMMGGSVDLASEPGKGTTLSLTLSLPVVDPAKLPANDLQTTGNPMSAITSKRRTAPNVDDAESEGTLVLIVDDHPTNRALLVRQVQVLGYAAESAENGVEALALWRTSRFGLLITDCNMPEMDGYELARSIRRLESGSPGSGGKRTPIIACTAFALGGEAEICLAAGMDDYLRKPVELRQILEKLDRWLPIPGMSTPPSAAAGEGPAAPASAPVDRSVLAAMLGGDDATERDVLVDFRRTNDKDAAMLEQAVAANDVPQVTRATHRISGASRMVGAHALAGVCDRIGHAGRSRDWPAVAEELGAFHREWTRLNAYVDALQ